MNTGTIIDSNDGFSYRLDRKRKLSDSCEPSGFFLLTVTRKGKIIHEEVFKNASTTQGKNYLLDAGFRNTGTTALWYISLVDKASFSTFALADTSASHGGWIEFQDYTEAVRQTWVKSAASGGIMSASSAAQFTIAAVAPSTFLKGAFITSLNTKGGTTGFLWATGQFAEDIPIQEDDILNLTYFIQLT